MGTRRTFTTAVILLALFCGFWTLGPVASGPSVPPPQATAPQTSAPKAAAAVALPNRADSLKFAVLGDFGTGDRAQAQLGTQMATVRARFPFELVITVGDNIYGSQRPQDMKRKFEDPYKALLDGGVKFYASLGNHDDRAQSRYKLFNMEGRTYYSFKAPRQDVRFFALETDYLEPKQVAWLEKELDSSGERWKIPYFHHPLYSSGDRHGSHADLAKVLEPLFLQAGVTVVFSGHDHIYERVKPQKEIVYFVTGSGGKLRRGGTDRKSGLSAAAFDTDQAFLVVEIDGDQLFFNAISRMGNIIDSGVIERRKQPQP